MVPISSPHHSVSSSYGLDFTASLFRRSDDFELAAMEKAETEWHEAKSELALRKEALLKAKEDYEGAVQLEKTKFAAYSAARRALE